MSDVLDRMDGRTRTRAVTAGIDQDRLLTPPEWEGQYDPHVWMDVCLWIEAVQEVANALAEADPDGREQYERSAAEFVRELEDLETWVWGRVEELPPERRILVTAHDAFNYFGEAYGFEVRGLQGLSTATEAGIGDVRRLADFIVEHRLPSIFIETSIPRRNVEAVQAAARSRGHRVEIGGELFSDAMGPAGTPEGTYPGMIRHNVNTIVDGLSLGIAEAVAEGAP